MRTWCMSRIVWWTRDKDTSDYKHVHGYGKRCRQFCRRCSNPWEGNGSACQLCILEIAMCPMVSRCCRAFAYIHVQTLHVYNANCNLCFGLVMVVGALVCWNSFLSIVVDCVCFIFIDLCSVLSLIVLTCCCFILFHFISSMFFSWSKSISLYCCCCCCFCKWFAY
jgi:hypothetical protein